MTDKIYTFIKNVVSTRPIISNTSNKVTKIDKKEYEYDKVTVKNNKNNINNSVTEPVQDDLSNSIFIFMQTSELIQKELYNDTMPGSVFSKQQSIEGVHLLDSLDVVIPHIDIPTQKNNIEDNIDIVDANLKKIDQELRRAIKYKNDKITNIVGVSVGAIVGSFFGTFGSISCVIVGLLSTTIYNNV